MSYIRNKWEEIGTETLELVYNTYGIRQLPKVITYGIAAHGYGGDHSGSTSADKLNMSNETVSALKAKDEITERRYCGWGNDFNNNRGYAFGGTADTKTNCTKMDLSDGSTSEISVSDSLIDGGARGGLYCSDKSYIASDKLDNLLKYNYSDDTSSDSGIGFFGKGHNDIFWTDWINSNGYMAEFDGNGFKKINLNNNSVSTLSISHNMGDRDNIWTSFGDTTIGTMNGISGSFNFNNNRMQKFNFRLENFIILSTWSYQSGEITQVSGESAYAMGGYGSGSQNGTTQAFEYDTGLSRNLPSQSYPRSSGAGYM